MIKQIVYLLEIIAFFLICYLFYAANQALDFLSTIQFTKYALYALSIMYILYGIFQLISTSQSTIYNSNKTGFGLRFVILLSYISLAILLYAISYMIEVNYDGQFFSFVAGIFVIIFALILLIKEKNSDGIYTFPRLVIACLLAVLVYFNMHLFVPLTPKYQFVENMIDRLEFSREDASLVAAWYDINNGYNKDLVIKSYNIEEDQYNQKAESLVYSNIGKVPQKRTIELISNDFKDKKVKDLISPNDKKYFDSLRPIFHKMCFSERDLEVLDLFNLANHSNNEEFFKYLKNEYKWYYIHIKENPESYFW